MNWQDIALRDPRIGHKDHVEWETVDTEYGPGRIAIGSHFDGSVDATVKVDPVRIRIVADAPPVPEVTAAVLELQAANRHYRMMREAEAPEHVMARAARWVAEAQHALEEVS